MSSGTQIIEQLKWVQHFCLRVAHVELCPPQNDRPTVDAESWT
jgi:hypothetical protein